MNYEDGGFLTKLLWSISILNIEKDMRKARIQLQRELASKGKDPKGYVAKFNDANNDIIEKAAQARQFFRENPEFMGLLKDYENIPIEKTSKNDGYFDSFDCQVQCEEVYDENPAETYADRKEGD